MRELFCTARRDLLLAITDRRPERLDATVIEISASGELYIPHQAWTSDSVCEDWPGQMRLQLNGGSGFAQPEARSGLATYCIWKNLAHNGKKGVAVIHNIADRSGNIDFLEPRDRRAVDDDGVDWFEITTVDSMYWLGPARGQGTTISAPILLREKQARNTLSCIGAVNITHHKANELSSEENYVWASECGTLMGVLYESCRERLGALGAFDDWKNLNDVLENGTQGSRKSEVVPKEPIRYDSEQMKRDLEPLMRAKTQNVVAGEMKLGVRTLTDALSGRACTETTAAKIAAYMSANRVPRTVTDYELPRTPKAG